MYIKIQLQLWTINTNTTLYTNSIQILSNAQCITNREGCIWWSYHCLPERWNRFRTVCCISNVFLCISNLFLCISNVFLCICSVSQWQQWLSEFGGSFSEFTTPVPGYQIFDNKLMIFSSISYRIIQIHKCTSPVPGYQIFDNKHFAFSHFHFSVAFQWCCSITSRI